MELGDKRLQGLTGLQDVLAAVSVIASHTHKSAPIPLATHTDSPQQGHETVQEGLRARAQVMGANMGEQAEYASAVNVALQTADRQRAEFDRSRVVISAAAPEEPKDKATEKDAPKDAPAAPQADRATAVQTALRSSSRAVGADTALAAEAEVAAPLRDITAQKDAKGKLLTAPDGLTLATKKSAEEGLLSGNFGKNDKQPEKGDKPVVLQQSSSSDLKKPPATPPVPSRPQPAARMAPPSR